jgi:hypothetical protein
MLPAFEVWKWIIGYEGRAEISNRGRVRLWTGRHVGVKGRIKFLLTPFVVKKHATKHGYIQTTIGSIVKSDSIKIRIHRQVAIAFVENNDIEKVEVNHIDGDKTNNNWYNLEWVSRHENIDHAFSNGLIIAALGENQSNTKLKNNQVIEIYKSNDSTEILKKRYGVSSHTIRDIKNGRTWWHLTGQKRHIKPSEIGKFKKIT